MKLSAKKRQFIIPINTMSDIAFQLLIFIMLVALINYRREVNIRYALAETPKKVNVEKNLEVWIDREGYLYLNGINCGIDTIEAGIIQACSQRPDTRVHIIADRDTQFAHVQAVLRILQILQHREVSLVVKAI